VNEETSKGVYVEFDEGLPKHDGLGDYRSLGRFFLLDGEYEFIDEDDIVVGDTVKLDIPEGEKPSFGWCGVENGSIGKVVDNRLSSIYTGKNHVYDVNFEGFEGWTGVPNEFKLIAKGDYEDSKDDKTTDEEVYYPKKGDIVRVVDGITSGHEVGTIGEVVEGDGTNSPYVEANGIQKYNTVELVCRAEDRADRQ